MLTEQEALDLVKNKQLRLVCTARKRKLIKKGVSVRWIQSLNSWGWFINEEISFIEPKPCPYCDSSVGFICEDCGVNNETFNVLLENQKNEIFKAFGIKYSYTNPPDWRMHF